MSNARDQVILIIGFASLAVLIAGIAIAGLVGIINDRLRNRADDGGVLGAGTEDQARAHRELLAAHERDKATQVRVDLLDEQERQRRAQWRARLDAEISDVNERFAKLTEGLDDEIVWTVDISSKALDAATATATRRLGRPDPRRVIEWATGELHLGDPSWHSTQPARVPRRRRSLESARNPG